MPALRARSRFARHATIVSTVDCPGRAMELREVLGSRSKWIIGRRGKARSNACGGVTETLFDNLHPLLVEIFHANALDPFAFLFARRNGTGTHSWDQFTRAKLTEEI